MNGNESSIFSRAEHLQWCKDRALQYLDMGDLRQAFASFASDMGKHPATDQPGYKHAIKLGFKLMMVGLLDDPMEMRKWINGFH